MTNGNNTFSGNSALSGGIAQMGTASDVRFHNVTILANSALAAGNQNGGGIFLPAIAPRV